MKPTITRRALAKILVLFPGGVSLLNLSCASGASSRNGASGDPPSTAAEREALAKSLATVRGALDGLNRMPVPMGTEPAFTFQPLIKK